MAKKPTATSALMLNRRDFLKTSGAVALAVSLGACGAGPWLNQPSDDGPPAKLDVETSGYHLWSFDKAEYTLTGGVHLWEIKATSSRVWITESTQRIRVESGCVYESAFLWDAITPSRVSACIAKTMPNDWSAITGVASNLLGNAPISAVGPV